MRSFRETSLLTAPKIPVSWGDLIDKITILEIKAERLSSDDAVANVNNELRALMHIVGDALTKHSELASMKRRLRSINESLWEIENKIRAKEATKEFDRQFIHLARSVYMNNDKRGEIKRQINTLLNSELFEEKQYTTYSP